VRRIANDDFSAELVKELQIPDARDRSAPVVAFLEQAENLQGVEGRFYLEGVSGPGHRARAARTSR
jgi:hypothetical protein